MGGTSPHADGLDYIIHEVRPRHLRHEEMGEERLAALEAECARLVALGAARVRLLPADDDNESCIVMQDLEGNEFCLD